MRILRYGLTLLLLSSYCAPVFACDEGSISDCCIFKEAGQKRFTLTPSRINLIELQDKNYYGGFANKVTILTGTKRSPYFDAAAGHSCCRGDQGGWRFAYHRALDHSCIHSAAVCANPRGYGRHGDEPWCTFRSRWVTGQPWLTLRG